MKLNERFAKLATDATLEKAASALQANGLAAVVVESGQAAKTKVLELIPQTAEVFTMSSTTLEQIGLMQAINESGKYVSVRKKLTAMDRAKQGKEMNALGAVPDWTVGSVHAVTEDGHVFVASNTGSQLGPYAYGADHVIWVVGSQKVVKDDAKALKRINEYVLPLERERIRKLYNRESEVSKLLVVNIEKIPGRITVILVKEKLGF